MDSRPSHRPSHSLCTSSSVVTSSKSWCQDCLRLQRTQAMTATYPPLCCLQATFSSKCCKGSAWSGFHLDRRYQCSRSWCWWRFGGRTCASLIYQYRHSLGYALWRTERDDLGDIFQPDFCLKSANLFAPNYLDAFNAAIIDSAKTAEASSASSTDHEAWPQSANCNY